MLYVIKVHPLYVACLEGYEDIVKELLSYRAGSGGGHHHHHQHQQQMDVNMVGITQDGSTPLMGACEGGHLSIVQLLLEYGANPNAKARGMKTTFSFFFVSYHIHIVIILYIYIYM